jgi:hypothetical protein
MTCLPSQIKLVEFLFIEKGAMMSLGKDKILFIKISISGEALSVVAKYPSAHLKYYLP